MYIHCIIYTDNLQINMNTNVTKWGNSLAVRLPKSFTEQIGITQDSKVELEVKNKTIIIKKMNYDLKDLLTRVESENIHMETSTGDVTGKEIW